MGTVKVLGQGEVKFAPDVTRVTVEVDALHETYQEAFDAGALNTNRPQRQLQCRGGVGFNIVAANYL